MSNWEKWYQNFLLSNKESMLAAFKAGYNGEKYEPKINLNLDLYNDWSTIIFLCRDKNFLDKYGEISFSLIENNFKSPNPLIVKCFNKSKKNNTYYESPIFDLIVFNHLRESKINNIIELIKILRELPESLFSICRLCSFENEPGYLICSSCKTSIEDSILDQNEQE